MHISSVLSSLPAEKRGSREKRGNERVHRANEEVQNIALRGSNLPDGRKGAARTRKMRNSTRNGRMFWNHGTCRSFSDNVKAVALVCTCVQAHTRIHIRKHAAKIHTRICVRTRDRYHSQDQMYQRYVRAGAKV